jgi:hypothetical protein
MKNEEVLKNIAMNWNETEMIKKNAKEVCLKSFIYIYISSDKTCPGYRCSKSCGVTGEETSACLCCM